MSEIQSELKAAPQLIKALHQQSQPLECLEIWEWSEDGKDERVTVWAEQIDRHLYKILSPVWSLKGFSYGDIISTTTEYCSGETFQSVDDIVTPSDWVTLAILPNAPVANTEDVFNALDNILRETEWICEVLDNAILIVILHVEDHQKYAQALDDALHEKGLIQSPGPWCKRFLEATKAGNSTRALAEFLVGNGDNESQEKQAEPEADAVAA